MSRKLDGQRGREIEGAYLEWRTRWPQAYQWIVETLEDHYRRGVPCTLGLAIEDARKRDFTDAHGAPFRGISNTIRPAMCRHILQERPHLRGYLEHRISHLDVVGGGSDAGTPE